MKVLVACEFSGVVRRAFLARGHDAWSCDLLPADDNSEKHSQCDVLDIINNEWDLLIAHPPCTHLAVSGAKWFFDRRDEQEKAVMFFLALAMSNVPKICVENPIGVMSTEYRKPDQIIQPWMFGHGEVKATCLWLENLPKLRPTNIVDGREERIFRMPPSKNRSKDRSVTYEGIANAMAEQWGS